MSAAEKVLIIDNDTEHCKQIKYALDEYGIGAYYALSVVDGIERLMGHSYELVILDISLSERDGLQLLRFMRQTKDTPILVLSSQGDYENKERAYQMGVDDFMELPIPFCVPYASLSIGMSGLEPRREHEVELGLMEIPIPFCVPHASPALGMSWLELCQEHEVELGLMEKQLEPRESLRRRYNAAAPPPPGERRYTIVNFENMRIDPLTRYVCYNGRNLSFVYEETAHLYSRKYGRPPIDPVVMVKYLLSTFAVDTK